jgi:hypothetical protein
MNHWSRTEKFISHSLPNFRSVHELDLNALGFFTAQPHKIDVFNAQSQKINVKVSSSTSEHGNESFFAIKPGQIQESWHRGGNEVIYVNGPDGTGVGAYYGQPGHVLIANNPV